MLSEKLNNSAVYSSDSLLQGRSLNFSKISSGGYFVNCLVGSNFVFKILCTNIARSHNEKCLTVSKFLW